MIQKVFAFQNENNILKYSSSGGAFWAICETIKKTTGAEKEFITYGAAYDSEMNVKHQRAKTEQERRKFCGSKYIESDMSSVYQQIEQDLLENRIVLFTGVPCQVFAIKHYCKRKELPLDNLYLVDIICHGVPNISIWNSYKKWLEEKEKSKLVDFQFRYKGSRWKQYPVRAVFENGKVLVNTHRSRLYTNLFFTALPLREACYHCKFANLERHSDLSIGDFWGIENIMPKFPRNKGVSEILVNTNKGEKLIQMMKETLEGEFYLEECHSENFVIYQHNLNKPTQKPQELEQFRKDIKLYSFDEILKKYAGNNIRGKTLHCVKKVCGELGITPILKKVLETLK